MKILFFCLVLFVMAACRDQKDSPAPGETANPTNVENVNGNIPDTTTGVTLNNNMAQDSSKLKDTTHH